MDLPLTDFRRMAVEEFDTGKLLAHAAQQAHERGYKNFPIVDVDSHHYESESIGEILDYMDDPVLQQLARSARTDRRQERRHVAGRRRLSGHGRARHALRACAASKRRKPACTATYR